MATNRMSRRGLLKNTALMTLLAPVLRRRDAGAAGATARNVIFLYAPNGPMEVAGPASGTERSFTIHPWWAPLEAVKEDGIFLSHMAPAGAGEVPGAAHGLGAACLSGYGTSATSPYDSAGETIDQTIARQLTRQQRAGIKSAVYWGLWSGRGFYAGPEQYIRPQLSPSKAWAELFANFIAPAPTEAERRLAEARIARRQSVLDLMNRDCVAVGDLLGAEGKRLLDDHCTTLRSMELNLQTSLKNPAIATCVPPAKPTQASTYWSDPEHVDEQMSLFVDLIVTALACELTHVVGFMFGGSAARNRISSSYGVPSAPLANSGDSGPAHHPWTHHGKSAARTNALRIFQSFYAAKTAALVQKLKSTVVAGQSLLRTTLVLSVSELGGHATNVDGHQTGALPVTLFGGSDELSLGRYIRGSSPETAGAYPVYLTKHVAAGKEMAQLLVSVKRYMGLPDSTVGVSTAQGPFAKL